MLIVRERGEQLLCSAGMARERLARAMRLRIADPMIAVGD